MKPPAHLGKGGKKFWTDIHKEYEFSDSAELALVVAASECLDRMEAAKQAIKDYGEITLDRYWQPRVSPACELERRAKGQFLQILKQLGLEDDGQHIDRRYQNQRHRERRHGPKKTKT